MKNPANYVSPKYWKFGFLSLVIFFSFIGTSFGQRPSPSVGIGFQAGSPTGLSLQFYKDRGVTTDILFAYHSNNFYFLNVHGLWNAHLDSGGHFHLYYGPGGFVGVRTYRSDIIDDDVVAGFSGNLGLNFVVSRLEFFGQVTPRLELTPGTNLNMGGGVGLRFFF